MIIESRIILQEYIKKIFENFDLTIYNSSKKRVVELKQISFFVKKLNITNHFIDFFHVLSYLIICFFFIKKTIKSNKRILFTSFNQNKKISQLLIHHFQRANELYINDRWKSGSLTNISVCLEQIKKLKVLKKKKLNSTFSIKEAILLEKKIKKLEIYYQGLLNLNSLPGLVINFNQKHQTTIIDECNSLKIPVINIIERFWLKSRKENISIFLNSYNFKKIDFFLKQIISFIFYIKTEKSLSNYKKINK